jgi:hypothetical protein
MPPLDERERTFLLLGKILDLSLDIGRNRLDGDFVAEGGELFYVFDENLFEVFFQPSPNAHIVNSLHSANLHPTRKPRERSIDQQIALITSEYLLAENLPGAKRNLIYMTRGHRQELRRRIGAINDKLEELFGEEPDVAINELEEKIKALAGVTSKNEAIRFSVNDDPELTADMTTLADRGAKRDSLRRLQLTRIGAKLLAASEVSEPLDQLKRALIAPIHNRIRTLHLDFTPTRRELQLIEADTGLWLERLKDENDLEDQRRRELEGKSASSRRRAEGKLWTDAQSLALVRWAARKAYSNQRLVMITGDRITFNAYRRWYADLKPGSPSYYESFILRRASHYLPVLNLRDTDNDISRSPNDPLDTRSIFTRLQGNVEIALLPFNISQHRLPDGNVKEMEASRRRHYLALQLYYLTSLEKAPELASIANTIKPGWYQRTRDHVLSVLAELRNVERLSIGSFLPYISRRFSDEHRQLAKEIAQKGGEEAGKILKGHLTNILYEIREKSADAWLPALAEEFIDDLEPPPVGRRRVPLTIWYPIGDDKDITDLIERWLSKPAGVNWREIFHSNRNHPQAPFVIAATLALFSDEWSDADRFAEIGAKDFLANGAGARPGHELILGYELKFLSALTKRFRLGDIDSHFEATPGDTGFAAPSGTTSMLQIFERGQSILDECLEYHQAQFSDPSNASRTAHQLRVLRAHSERGALRAFAAASLIPDGVFAQEDWRISRATKLIEEAQRDLATCFALAKAAENPDTSKLLERLRRQYVPLTVSTEVIRSLLFPKSEFTLNEEFRKYEKPAREYLENSKASTFDLVRAELLCFFILLGSDDARKCRAELKGIVSGQVRQSLALDRWLLEALRRRYLDGA